MLKTIILFALAILQVKLIYTGDILYYLSPKMLPFFYFSTTVFLLLAAYRAMLILAESSGLETTSQACDCCAHDEDASRFSRTAMYILFCLPLLTGFLVPPKLLDSSLVDKKGIIYREVASTPSDQLPSETRQQYTDQPGEIDHEWWEEYEFETQEQNVQEEEQQALRDELGIWYDEDYYRDLADRLIDGDKIVVSDSGHLDVMLVIAAYQEEFQGREIELTGFVYRDDHMSRDEVALTRTAITCCLADATFYGTLIRGEDLHHLERDQWITVKGEIDLARVQGQNMIMINARQVQEIDPPDSPYVYPYLYQQYNPEAQ